MGGGNQQFRQTLYSQSAAARPGGALHRQPSVATSVDSRPFVVWTSSGSIAVGAHHERLSTRITSQKGRHHQGHHQRKGAQRRKTQANEKRRRHQRQEIE